MEDVHVSLSVCGVCMFQSSILLSVPVFPAFQGLTVVSNHLNSPEAIRWCSNSSFQCPSGLAPNLCPICCENLSGGSLPELQPCYKTHYYMSAQVCLLHMSFICCMIYSY